jgi:hypothetical protein
VAAFMARTTTLSSDEGSRAPVTVQTHGGRACVGGAGTKTPRGTQGASQESWVNARTNIHRCRARHPPCVKTHVAMRKLLN